MDSDEHKKMLAAMLACGILSPVLDWTPEQRAAAEPEPESNVIDLAKYRAH